MERHPTFEYLHISCNLLPVYYNSVGVLPCPFIWFFCHCFCLTFMLLIKLIFCSAICATVLFQIMFSNKIIRHTVDFQHSISCLSSIRRYRRMLASRSMTRWRRVLHRGLYFHGNSLPKGNPLFDSSSTDTDTEFGMMKTHVFKSSVSNKTRMLPRLFVSSLSHLRNTTTKLGRHSGRLPAHTIPDPLKLQGIIILKQ